MLLKLKKPHSSFIVIVLKRATIKLYHATYLIFLSMQEGQMCLDQRIFSIFSFTYI